MEPGAESGPEPGAEPGLDAAEDAGREAGSDPSPDAREASLDAQVDASRDADASLVDTGRDVEAGVDAPPADSAVEAAADAGVEAAADAASTCPNLDLANSLGTLVGSGTTSGFPNRTSGLCGSSGPEVSHAWRAPFAGRFRFSTAGSGFSTTMYVRADGCSGIQLACNVALSAAAGSTIDLDLNADQSVVVFVDGGTVGGRYMLTITETCAVSSSRSCYTGRSGTAGVGRCRAGTQTCVSAAWSACTGQVVPAAVDLCSNGEDDNCDGTINEGCTCGPLADCSGTCVDVRTDPSNCGTCGSACPAGNSCQGGVCCGPGLTACSGVCQDLQTNASNCGACGTTCAAFVPRTARCSSGSCVYGCIAGYHECSGTCVTDASVNSCGTRCAPCDAGPNSTVACTGGACVLSCTSGWANCDGNPATGCEARLTGDVNHCGTCSTVCAPQPHAVPACTGTTTGTCTIGSCDSGYRNCDGQTANGCETSITSDRANCGGCGTACAAGLVCVDGACTLVCPAGQTNCGGTCKDLAADSTNCGACGYTCPGAGTCVSGSCTPDPAVEVVRGRIHSCARRASGSVDCWGPSGGATLPGTTAGSLVPAPTGIVADRICAGSGFTCALLRDRSVRCWGDNANFQLGAGASVGRPAVPPDVVELRCGGSHACVRTASGAVHCWGANSFGQLGRGTTTASGVPGPVIGLPAPSLAIALGGGFSCSVDASGLVSCWGLNDDHQCGVTSTANVPAPTVVSGLSGIVALPERLGLNFACAIRADRSVACWGNNRYGQLGRGTLAESWPPVSVPALSGVRFMDLQGESACAVDGSSSLLCWGMNSSFELGLGSTATTSSPTVLTDRFTRYEPLRDVSGASLGALGGCAVLASGAVRCWGHWTEIIGDGQLNNTTEGPAPRYVPEPVLRFPPMVTEAGTCADGVDNDADGQLDDADSDCVDDLGSRIGLVFHTRVTWGNYWTMPCGRTSAADRRFRWTAPRAGNYAIDTRGSAADLALSIGTNCNDNEATNTTAARVTFTAAAGETVRFQADTRAAIAGAIWIHDLDAENACTDTMSDRRNCGTCGHACATLERCESGVCVSDRVVEAVPIASGVCALRESGRVWCWGSNASGQLGNGGATSNTQPTVLPYPVPYLEDAAQLSGGGTVCVRHRSGLVSCWGAGDAVGNGGSANALWPTLIPDLESVEEVRVAAVHGCARTTSGAVHCWGVNQGGQIGDGSYLSRAAPVPIQGLAGPSVAIAVGGEHSCSLAADGALQCWGRNGSSEIDPGNTNPVLLPRRITGVSNVARLPSGLGDRSLCVIGNDRTVTCWGGNLYGQLGRGTVSTTESPAVVPGVDNVVGLSQVGSSACALRSSGEVWCWGAADWGQLGNGTAPTNRPTPAPVLDRFASNAPLRNVVSIGFSGWAGCAVTGLANVMCWGNNSSNQLGDWQVVGQGLPRWNPQPVVAFPPVAAEDGNCSDTLDNDRDGRTDGEDADCAMDIGTAIGTAVYSTTLDGRFGNYIAASCGGGSGRETVLRWTAPTTGTFTFDARSTAVPTVLSVRAGSWSGGERACGSATNARFSLSLTAGQVQFIVIDSSITTRDGAVSLSITSP